MNLYLLSLDLGQMSHLFRADAQCWVFFFTVGGDSGKIPQLFASNSKVFEMSSICAWFEEQLSIPWGNYDPNQKKYKFLIEAGDKKKVV